MFGWGGIDSPDAADGSGKLSSFSALNNGLGGGMPDLFSATLFFICVGCVALIYLFTRSGLEKRDGPKGENVDGCHNPQFLSLQRSYLTVYLLGVAGDWLQGPYVYALYEFYGMSKHQIELLFIAGFASSLVFGTFIGSIADKYGRRTNCFLYAFLYGLACLTKHFADFSILLLGRLLGGIATSILFSAFESWLVYEHNQRGIDSRLLATIFSNAILGNSLVAIISGMGAQLAADFFGYVAPFDVALILLILMVVIMVGTWPENYGDSKAPVHQSFVDAFYTIKNDAKVLFLGLVQGLFEGAMYTFVLEWTPALSRAYSTESSTDSSSSVPHGYVFASFMVSVMIGSSLFKLLSRKFSPESLLRYILLVSAGSLATPILFPHNGLAIFLSFTMFEMCVGVFWPAMAYLRGLYLPEQTRSTTMNFFRIPLNLIVVVILWQNFAMDTIFKFCVGFLLLGAIGQQFIYKLTKHERYQLVGVTDCEQKANLLTDDKETAQT